MERIVSKAYAIAFSTDADVPSKRSNVHCELLVTAFSQQLQACPPELRVMGGTEPRRKSQREPQIATGRSRFTANFDHSLLAGLLNFSRGEL